ncbi:WecB/TagA/CpsF family glycosyltransferase [Dyadobacter frigoris]|uniref:WecB/TagA/CpsF family glycosyltransferase n=1 Tax=Dyadobacter frigoris TaxID=2576211 RepID=A0A4U6CTS5_9BACT|nr:WecB/TagA/CpsF family glycosyltransferase [Dyadobacter frigoris]TKT87646.1 WecB/TagA/CpsF family glycosyltransferase [Dyadobacter frigoris]
MKKAIISLNITTGSYRMFIDNILALINDVTSCYICVANVHMLVEAYNDPRFASIVNKSVMTTPDGMPLVWSMNILHGIKQDRVAGMDLLPDLLKETSEKQIPVYFYGGTQEMLNKTKQFIITKYPGSVLAGLHSPPFRELTKIEENDIVEKINQSGAKILFVALGCPKQEKWMASMKGRIMMPMIGIGGALPVMVGLQKRAPEWLQKTSLEWLYRLTQEPKRLFKRYAITNSSFIWLLFKAVVQKKISKRSPELHPYK